MTLSDYLNGLKGKKVTVMGIGISNRPLIKLLLDTGISVTAHDKQTRERLGETADTLEKAGCKLILGENYLDGIDGDVIFRSPGIRPDLPAFEKAVSSGAVLTSEMEAFFEVCPCRIIAVTGSDGKTTTTSIIAELLKTAGYTVHIGGNIGTPLLDRADCMKKDDICVLELSSFQLMTMKKSPDIAVITNIAPNHLDIHRDMQEYVDAKKNIFQNAPQPEIVVLNADNDITRAFAESVTGEVRYFSIHERVGNGAFLDAGTVFSCDGGKTTYGGGKYTPVVEENHIKIPGIHNVENYMAAFSAVRDFVSAEVMEKVARSFGGVEHRIEFVRELRGVKYYNDSIASSPSRTTAGLRSFDEKVILIAGGKDKGVPFDGLGKEICEHVKALVVTGWTAGKIKDAVLNAGGTMPIIEEEDFEKAVKTAAKIAKEGDTVLLSPACTSFDRFKNFEERGRFFKDIVNGLE